jgi:hypothetical protein
MEISNICLIGHKPTAVRGATISRSITIDCAGVAVTTVVFIVDGADVSCGFAI